MEGPAGAPGAGRHRPSVLAKPHIAREAMSKSELSNRCRGMA
jgi:hypothetical protein